MSVGGSPSPQPRALLVAIRDPDDPMIARERACFADAAALPVDHVAVHPILAAPLTASAIRGVDVVFFGGSGAYGVLDGAAWMPRARDALLRTVDLRRPAWASCFGFQALAVTLGGEVVHDPSRFEMGPVELERTAGGAADPLFGALPPRFWTQQGHKDHVLRLPHGVTRLAAGGVGVEQAFRVDGAPFYASQFHPELDRAALRARFEMYRAHYAAVDPDGFEDRLAAIDAGGDTPEVAALLARLARGEVG